MNTEIRRLLRKVPREKIIHSRIDPGRTCKNVQLIYTDMPVKDEQIIYIGNSSFLPTDMDDLTACCLMIRCDDNRSYADLNCDYILIDESADIIEIYETLLGVLTTLENKACLDFYVKLVATANIIDMINLASQVMECPLLVSNENSQMLAYSGTGFMDDPAFSEIVLTGHTSKLHKQASTQDGTIQTIMESAEIPIAIGPGRYFARKRIVGNVTINETQKGFVLALQQKRAFTSFDIKLVSTVCDAAAYLAVQSTGNERFANLSGLLFHNLLQSLLNGDSVSMDELEKWLLPCKENDARLWIFVADADSEQADDTPLIEALHEFCRKEHVLTCCHEKMFVILLNVSSDAIPDQLHSSLSALLLSYHRYAGTSSRFTGLCDIRSMYLQALQTLTISKLLSWKNRVVSYQEVKIYQLLLSVDRNTLLQEFYDDSLDVLRRYDRQRGTQYYQTLYTYLKCACDRGATAKFLCYHRNTVAYQLRKIEEILDTSLSDGERCQQLYLSCKINELRCVMKGKL